MMPIVQVCVYSMLHNVCVWNGTPKWCLYRLGERESGSQGYERDNGMN